MENSIQNRFLLTLFFLTLASPFVAVFLIRGLMLESIFAAVPFVVLSGILTLGVLKFRSTAWLRWTSFSFAVVTIGLFTARMMSSGASFQDFTVAGIPSEWVHRMSEGLYGVVLLTLLFEIWKQWRANRALAAMPIAQK